MSTTTTVPRYQLERARVRGMILDNHRGPDGEVDRAGLVAEAIRRRREVERLEALVQGGEPGEVTQAQRDELTQAQWWDHHLQAALRAEIPQWDGAIANARTGFSKTMSKAARSLGLAG
jgi:hypothetical protein